MGRQTGDQASLFYEFRLEDRIPKDHLLRRINVFMGPVLDSVREQLKPYYSETGRPSVDPELMIRVLIVGYCYGLRSERRLTQEVALHLAYRWFCRLDLDGPAPLDLLGEPADRWEACAKDDVGHCQNQQQQDKASCRKVHQHKTEGESGAGIVQRSDHGPCSGTDHEQIDTASPVSRSIS